MAEIQQLRDMGFAAAEAEVALRETNGNVEQALELLLTGALRSDSPDESPKKTGSVSPKDSEWPELPKKPPPTPSSPSGYGKSDAKPPGLEQDDALGLSLEASFCASPKHVLKNRFEHFSAVFCVLCPGRKMCRHRKCHDLQGCHAACSTWVTLAPKLA